jgi:hypothetical protein
MTTKSDQKAESASWLLALEIGYNLHNGYSEYSTPDPLCQVSDTLCQTSGGVR